MITWIIAGLVITGILILLFKRTDDKAHFGIDTKCRDCGYKKGILKCPVCEGRKRENWR